MRKLVILVVVAMVGVGVAATAAGAAPPTVSITSCGQVITTDAVLRTDLTCPGTALTVEANGVSVRLAGHTIRSSDGTGVGVQLGILSYSSASVRVQNVVIRGGTISGFATGIYVVGLDGAGAADQISRTTLTNNTNGVWISGGSEASVDRTTIVGTNGVTGNPYYAGDSIITNSTITVAGGTNVLVGNTTITSSRLTGGVIDAPTDLGVTIQRSYLSAVTVGCGDTNVVITDSHVVGGEIHGEGGCYMNMSRDLFTGPGSGTAIDFNAPFSVPSVVADSVFTGWGTAMTIANDTYNASITGNVFRHNVNGIVGCTAAYCGGGTITDNRFLDNAGVGLTVTGGTWHVGSNTALRNGGIGIDAQGAALTLIDDGGNIARHNQPPQCIGVVCAR